MLFINKKNTRFLKVKCLKNQALIADRCYVAECFFDRLIGLIGKTQLNPGDGMLFPECREIHMWFMQVPIDVVFIQREQAFGQEGFLGRISSTHENIRPWKILPLRDGQASETLELPAGTIQQFGINVGDELCIN